MLSEKLEKKKNEYSIHGGDIVEQREKLIHQRNEMIANVISSNEQLLELAGGELPLRLVKPLLDEISDTSNKEHDKKASLLAIEQIKVFYDSFSTQNKISKPVKDFMSFIEAQGEDGQVPEVYNLSDITLAKLKVLLSDSIDSSCKRAETIRMNRDKYQKKIDEIDSYLSVEIDERSLNRLFKDIKKIEKDIVNVEVEIEDLREKRSSVNGAYTTLESNYSKMAESVLSSLESIDEDERVVRYSHMAIEIINEYRIRLQEKKTYQLAVTMTECYKKLANKKTLIDKVIMDPRSLDLRYFNSRDIEVDKKSLSAGEKQLMVISLLWALAINSKKKLPVIIDTPLSRLDSAHRSSLVKKYFPKASDQTIILSTDSEIDEKYYKLLEKHIGEEYTLNYDDNEKRTTIIKGYFEW